MPDAARPAPHYASEPLAAGLSVVIVADRLGHNANTVLKTYGHLVANQDVSTRQAIDRLWSGAPVQDQDQRTTRKSKSGAGG